jgi:hypothetical protein
VSDIVAPTTPVKTKGNVSAGRSSKQFETILHNAAIGSGNSGGPLLDACGRVIGANTFGTISDGSDSEFYFAVSTREIMRFLRNANVKVHTSGIACKSMADVERAEAERIAGERALSAEEKASAEAKQHELEAEARQVAMFEVLSERENGTGLAGLALLLALAVGGVAWRFAERDDKPKASIAGAVSALLVAGGAWAWLARPGLSDIATRVDGIVANGSAEGGTAKPARALSGKLACTINLDRSRVTVSQTDDVALDWSKDGCDGDGQFGLTGEGWARLATSGDTVTLSSFDPASGEYVSERWFPDIEALGKLRTGARKLPGPACGAGDDASRELGAAQSSLVGELGGSPNERLVYECRPATGG